MEGDDRSSLSHDDDDNDDDDDDDDDDDGVLKKVKSNEVQRPWLMFIAIVQRRE